MVAVPRKTEPARVVVFPEWEHMPLRVRMACAPTDDVLFELCAVNRELRIERMPDGELLIMAPTGGQTGISNLSISGQLWLWISSSGLGKGFDSSTGFVLPDGTMRSPDAAWVALERWTALDEATRAKFVPLCPDFVIELRSPTDALADVRAKLTAWIANGARLGWLIDPGERRVHVFTPDGAIQVLDGPARVSGAPVLPGFALDMQQVW